MSAPKSSPLPLSALEALAAAHGTPYQLYSEAGITGSVRDLLAAFGHLPGFTQFYAVKALPNPAVLRLLVAAGCGLDCSSSSELHMAALLGVPPERVMYTSNYTSKSDLTIAVRQGVIINLDDASLLPVLAEVNGGGAPTTVCFRLNPGRGRTDSETASNVLGGPDAKFGVHRDAIVAAYAGAVAAGATRFGIHMMTGSCVMNQNYWGETVNALMDAVDEVRAALGIEFSFFNIGGGLGIPYKPNGVPVDLAGVAKVVGDALQKRAWGPPVAVYMENGRYLTGPHGWLVSRCMAVKTPPSGPVFFGLDACMSNLMRPGMYGSYHHITVPAEEGGPIAAANVVGPVCDSGDSFALERPMPPVAAGELVAILTAGAYGAVMASTYNTRLLIPEVLVNGAAWSVVRPRQTYEELIGQDRLPDWLAPAAPQSSPPRP